MGRGFTLDFIIDEERVLRYAEDAKEIAALPKQQLVSETEAFRSRLMTSWREKESLVLSELERITGMRLAGDFTVFVLHPKSGTGYVHDEKSLVWGLEEPVPSFSLYGIAHELLHCVTDVFFGNLSEKDQLKFHAIVHLSADEELRRVIAGGEYFDMPFLRKYDSPLIAQARKLLPAWKKFQANRNGTIFDFAKQCGIAS